MLTAFSSVRLVLSGTAAQGALRRQGHTYLLDPAGVDTDVAEADAAFREAGRLLRSDPLRADAAFERGLGLYLGELLSEEGPAEWVVEPREAWRARMAGAAYDLAVLRYAAGRSSEAVRAARQGLSADRHHDPLWRVLVAALRSRDDQAAADRAAGEYDDVLRGLAAD